jgi:hypothetical protein
MSDFFDEVQEELKNEKNWKMMKKLIPYIFACTIVILVSVASYNIWNTKNIQKQESLADEYLISYNEMMNKDLAKNKLEQIYHKSNKNMSAIAGMRQAELLLETNNQEQAIKIYDTIANNNKYDISLSMLARLKSMYLKLNSSIEGVDYEQEFKLLLSENCPWRHESMQLKALYLLSFGKKDEAETLLHDIEKSDMAPELLKTNAQKILSVIRN